MDAKTKLKARKPSRHVMGGLDRRPARSCFFAIGTARREAGVAPECGIEPAPVGFAEVFKRTLYVADLKPGGRDLAKDLSDTFGVLRPRGRAGDIIESDAEKGIPNVAFSDRDIVRRQAAGKLREGELSLGHLWKYAQEAGLAPIGAVTHPGARAEKTCHADR
jgi:hypothetical protein